LRTDLKRVLAGAPEVGRGLTISKNRLTGQGRVQREAGGKVKVDSVVAVTGQRPLVKRCRGELG